MNAIFGRELVAQGRLEAPAGELCHQLVGMLLADLPSPDLLILLECSVDTLLARAKTRGRSGETLDHEYVSGLAASYRRFADDWVESPIVRVDTGLRDVRKPAVFGSLVSEVRRALQHQS